MKNLFKKIQDVPKDKKLIVFDLDGTLTESKSDLDTEMAGLLRKLLEYKKVAVIGGAKHEQFQSQFLAKLKAPPKLLKTLFLFPATATAFYRYNRDAWKQIYIHNLSAKQKKRIFEALEKAFRELNYKHPKKTYGKLIEDRGTQVTFSFLGQDVVKTLGSQGLRLKEKWKKENTPLKLKIARTVQKYLPDLEVRAAGYTSIDVTRKGIDKEYGIKQIKKHLGVPFSGMLFVGDALFPGGNDYPVLRAGVQCFEVRGVGDTKKLIKHLLMAGNNKTAQ